MSNLPQDVLKYMILSFAVPPLDQWGVDKKDTDQSSVVQLEMVSDAVSLICTCRSVCRQWHSAASSDIVWEGLTRWLHNFWQDQNAIRMQLRHFTTDNDIRQQHLSPELYKEHKLQNTQVVEGEQGSPDMQSKDLALAKPYILRQIDPQSVVYIKEVVNRSLPSEQYLQFHIATCQMRKHERRRLQEMEIKRWRGTMKCDSILSWKRIVWISMILLQFLLFIVGLFMRQFVGHLLSVIVFALVPLPGIGIALFNTAMFVFYGKYAPVAQYFQWFYIYAYLSSVITGALSLAIVDEGGLMGLVITPLIFSPMATVCIIMVIVNSMLINNGRQVLSGDIFIRIVAPLCALLSTFAFVLYLPLGPRGMPLIACILPLMMAVLSCAIGVALLVLRGRFEKDPKTGHRYLSANAKLYPRSLCLLFGDRVAVALLMLFFACCLVSGCALSLIDIVQGDLFKNIGMWSLALPALALTVFCLYLAVDPRRIQISQIVHYRFLLKQDTLEVLHKLYDCTQEMTLNDALDADSSV